MTEESVYDVINNIKNAAINGEASALKCFIQLKDISATAESAYRELQDLATDEARAYDKEKPVIMGYKVEVKEVGSKFDYSECGDPVLERLNSSFKEVDTQVKERQRMLMTMKSGQTLIDEETGEAFQCYPPVKSSKTSVVITKQK